MRSGLTLDAQSLEGHEVMSCSIQGCWEDWHLPTLDKDLRAWIMPEHLPRVFPLHSEMR